MTNDPALFDPNNPEDTPERAARIGNADQLIGAVEVYDANGVPVPLLDDDGEELLGIATGENYRPPEGAA